MFSSQTSLTTFNSIADLLSPALETEGYRNNTFNSIADLPNFTYMGQIWYYNPSFNSIADLHSLLYVARVARDIFFQFYSRSSQIVTVFLTLVSVVIGWLFGREAGGGR